ncbi:MAG: hypothetical protein V3R41_05020 [Gammaproteobacteria bacterium]|nr:hypothetical protein [Gammaproteobacteria bacterium]
MTVRKTQYWILCVYLLLLSVAIPWYWPKDSTFHISGIPLWVIIPLAVALLTSVFTAYLLLFHKPGVRKHDDHTD